MVPGAGIEPARPEGREILSLLRLPISPPGRGGCLHAANGEDAGFSQQTDWSLLSKPGDVNLPAVLPFRSQYVLINLRPETPLFIGWGL